MVKDTDRLGGAAAAVTHWNNFPQKHSNIFPKSTSIDDNESLNELLGSDLRHQWIWTL